MPFIIELLEKRVLMVEDGVVSIKLDTVDWVFIHGHSLDKMAKWHA